MEVFLALMQKEAPRIQKALEAAILELPQPVQEIAAYSLLSGGKRLRPLLTICMARVFGRPNVQRYEEDVQLYRVAAVLEMLHVATLLHDDVLDNAQTRRGKNAAHIEFGISPCLLAGDALLAAGSCTVAALGDTRMMDILAKAMAATAAGEIREIALKGSSQHSLAAYIEVITGKTAWLLRAACELGALYAGAKPEQAQAAADFGLNLGLAFQMVDDALDFAPAEQTGKPMAGDVEEGKYTPPLMYYKESLDTADKEEFTLKFAEGLFTQEEREAVAQQICGQGFDEKTRELASRYLEKAQNALQKLPQNDASALLAHALTFVQQRQS